MISIKEGTYITIFKLATDNPVAYRKLWDGLTGGLMGRQPGVEYSFQVEGMGEDTYVWYDPAWRLPKPLNRVLLKKWTRNHKKGWYQ